MSDHDRVTITDGRAELEVVPANGGCITAYRWCGAGGTIDWLRPAPPGDEVPAVATACFPLVPYSNRIRDGRFCFRGSEYRLAKNFLPARHSIHGHGWQRPWDLVECGSADLTLAYAYDGPDWPAPYRAVQRFSLADGALSVTLTVTNEGKTPMPAGLGLHPYFLRTPACRLTAAVDAIWATDEEVMPTRLVPPTPGADPNSGLRPAETALDNCFTGFAGRATIDWPERRASLVMEATAPLDFLVVFAPRGADLFCVEPVSHVTDAVNLAARGRGDTGLRELAPGESLSAGVRFAPCLDDAP